MVTTLYEQISQKWSLGTPANISRTEALRTNRHDSTDRLPFVVTYNPSLPHIFNILRKHFHILLSSKRCREVFKHPHIVAHRRTSNLHDILVKAKSVPTITTPNNTSLPPGSFHCGQDCATCPYVTNGLTHYTFFSTGTTRQIKSHITCNLIYMIQCNRCHLQYIGEAKNNVSKTDSTNIDAQSTKITFNPNPPLLPNIFCLILIIAILTCK